MKSAERAILLLTALSIAAGLCACAEFYGPRKSRYTSSVVDYLYPSREVAEVPTIPRLSLPLRVGVAFVPESDRSLGEARLSEKDKLDLLERTSSEFKKLPFVREIAVIPSPYLTRGGGFANLDQIRTMYGIDVIALLSYDQVQHTDEGLMSLSYWTIVGAYVVRGEKNDTSTMLDAAIYDIASRKMLFRAPGLSHIKGTSTLVNLNEQLRRDALNGFRAAADNLVVNLQDELERFKARIKEAPQQVMVSHKPGYTGGGSLGGVFAGLLLLLGAMTVWRGRKP